MLKHGSSQMFNVHEFVVLQAHADDEFVKSSLASTTQELHEVSFSEFLNYTVAKKYQMFDLCALVALPLHLPIAYL